MVLFFKAAPHLDSRLGYDKTVSLFTLCSQRPRFCWENCLPMLTSALCSGLGYCESSSVNYVCEVRAGSRNLYEVCLDSYNG